VTQVQRRAYLVAFVAVIGLAVTSIASASPPVIDQYYEEIPTANGGVGAGGGGAGGGGGGTSGGGSLPAPILDQLESSVPPAVASELQEVATSTSLGAPAATFKKPVNGAGVSGSANAEAADPVSSAVTAATDGGEAHLTILLILIGLITASWIAAAARRRRRAPA
jgi:hypothetical protein